MSLAEYAVMFVLAAAGVAWRKGADRQARLAEQDRPVPRAPWRTPGNAG